MKHPNDEVFLHLEIAEYVIEKIRSGVFAEKQKIPSENELCQQFQTNRHTVRQAIGRVANLGWITPIQGKGSYVNSVPKPISYVLSATTSFSENMKNQGLSYQSKLLEWEKVKPTKEEQNNLAISRSDLVYRMEILRSIENVPISITTSVLPEQEVPNLEDYFEDFHSLYSILLEKYQFRPIRASSIFQAVLPVLKDAELLEVRENVPIIHMESLMNHPSGQPIEHSISRIRGDLHKSYVEY